MTKTVNVAYSIQCELIEEYNELLSSIDESIWIITIEDDVNLVIEFNGEYEV